MKTENIDYAELLKKVMGYEKPEVKAAKIEALKASLERNKSCK